MPRNPFPAAALLLWLALLAAFATLNYRLGHSERFLEPATVQQLQIGWQDSDITLTRDSSGWMGDGRPTRPGRVEQMLDILATCHSPQALAAINAPAKRQALTLNIDGKAYTLGSYNPFHHAHYLDDGTTAWLCSENLKAMLAQPPASWFASP